MSNVLVTVPTTGVSVAADIVSSVAYQNIKVVAGQSGLVVPIEGTTGTVASNAGGLVVRIAGGQEAKTSPVYVTVSSGIDVNVPGQVNVSGVVSVGSMPAVSGTVQVSGPVQVSGTVSVSGQQQVSGTVSVSGTVPVTGTIQNVVTVSTILTLLGTVLISGSVAISGTGLVSVVPGVSVSVGQLANVVVTTTASSGQSGPIVWLGQNQTLATVGTIVTVLGTQVVSVVPGLSVSIGGLANVVVTTTASSGQSGPIVWLGVGQTIATVQTVATILGTQVVSVVPGLSVVASITVSATVGTIIAVSGVTAVSNISTIVTLLGTVAVNVVAGGAGGGSVTTAGPSISATGQVVWLAGGQGTSVTPVFVSQINPPAGGGGSVTTAAPSISATGQIMFVVGGQSTTANPVFVSHIATQVVSVVPGLSVSAVVSGTLSILNVVPVTTAASVSVTALPVWLNPTQAVNVGSIASTVNVAIVAGAGGGGSVTTAAPSISATGQIVFVVGGQSTTVNPVFVSHVATQVVSVVPGLSVSAVVSGTLSILNVVPVTTAASVSVTALPVWLNPTQQVVVSGLAGVSVSAVVSGTISVLNVVPVTTAASVSVTAWPVWLNPTQQVVVSGFQGQSITGSVNIVSTALVTLVPGGSVSVVGTVQTIVTLLGTVAVSGNLVAGAPAPTGGYFLAVATTSAVSSSTQVLLMTAYVSTGVTVASSAWTIASGSVLMVYGLGFGWSQAAANNQATFMLMVTATGATISTVATAWAQVTFSTAAALSTVISSGFTPGGVIGLHSSITTIPFPWAIPGPAVVGVAVAATSSGATAFASINAFVVNSIPFAQPIMIVPGGSVGVSGTVIVSGQVVQTTTQASGVTGALMYVAASQTLTAAISNIVVVTTAASVSVSGIPVWMNPTQAQIVSIAVSQTVGTIIAVSGVTAVSTVSAVVSISNLSTVVTVLNLPYVTTAWATGVSTGLIVSPKDIARTNVFIFISSTIAGPSSMMLFTVQTGNTTGAAAGTSLYVIPAGRVLCIQNMYVICAPSAAVVGPAQMAVVVGSAAASVSLTATVGIAAIMPYAIQASTVAYTIGENAYVSAGSTMGIAISATSHSILGVIINGYLF